MASALLETEKSFRGIMGYEQLRMLKSCPDSPLESEDVAAVNKTG